MLLLQFSTSHYCRKARLALGYKGVKYRVENLTPGLHIAKVKPLTGLTTLPVLLPEMPDQPKAIGDSTQIIKFLESYQPEPRLMPMDPKAQKQALLLEDWFDESIGTATRFVYYQFRSNLGKAIDPSWSSQLIIQIVKKQYNINSASVALAQDRLSLALAHLAILKEQPYLIGDELSVADIAMAALLCPLAVIPEYQENYPWLFDRIVHIHQICQEPYPY